MKKLLKPLMAVVLLIGVLTNSAEAQTPANNDMNTSSDRDMTDDSGKWGLLGLLGFLGLIKLNKNNHNTGTYTTTPQNR